MTSIEKKLRKRAEWALRELRGIRRDETEDIFSRRHPIGPDDLLVENYLRKHPLSAFNPGVALLGDKVLVFPRLIFDYYSYTSSIGVFSLPLEGLISGDLNPPFETKIILWPQYGWEAVKGCEDPRVFPTDDGFWILYTAVGKVQENGRERKKFILAFADLDRDLCVRRKGFFSIAGPEGTLIPGNKDSTILAVEGRRARILTRPSFSGEVPPWLEFILSPLGIELPKAHLPDMCWRAEADMDELVIHEESLEPVLVPERWEYKVGWSTNAVPLHEGRYLVGWHGVHREDLSYRNGLAEVDREGNLLAISNYLLAPKGLLEEYGDRPLTVFGNGLLLVRDHLVWIGGVSDYAIGIFIAELDDVLRMLRKV